MNPFQLIQRFKKQLMIFFGVILMALFGVLGVFESLQGTGTSIWGGGQSQQNKTLATYKGGKLNSVDIANFRMRHNRAQGFLNFLAQSALSNNSRPQASPELLPIPSDEANQEVSDKQTIRVMLLAQKAQEEGFIVSDAAVDEYMRLVCDTKVPATSYKKAIKDAFGPGVSLQQIRDQLKVELSALNYTNMVASSFGNIPSPTETWEAFQKLNRKAKCTVFGIDVESKSISEEPSSSEIAKLYNEGKAKYPDLTGEKPGFKMLPQAAIGYFVAERTAFQASMVSAISDEEIEQRYESWKLNNDPRIVVVPEKKTEETPDSNAEEKLEGTEEKKEGTEEKPEGTEEKTAPVESSEKKTGDPQTKESADGKTEVKTEDKPAEKAEPKAEPKADKPKQDDGKKESSEGKKETEESGGCFQEETEPALETPQEEESESTTPAEPAENSEPQQPSPVPPEGVIEEKQFKPLDDEVKKLIRDSFVDFEMVQKKMDGAITNAKNQVDKYYFALRAHEASKGSTEELEKPDLPDFKKIAKRYGLAYKTVELTTISEFAGSEFGSKSIFNINPNTNQFDSVPVYAIVFGDFERQDAMKCERISDRFGGAEYLFWYSEKVDAHIPTQEDCKENIIEFWKTRQAFNAAMDEAAGLVKTLTADKKQLRVAKEGLSKDTASFTWLSENAANRNAPPAPSPVLNAEGVGEEFMKAVFALKQGELGYAPNRDRTKIYVFQVLEMDQDEKILQEMYLTQNQTQSQSMFVAVQSRRDALRKLFDEMEDEYNLEWKQ